MQLPFPFFRPPSPDEARRNAEGNKPRIEKTVFQEFSDTCRHSIGALLGIPRAVLVSAPLAVASRGINVAANVMGYPSIVMYRVSRYIEDARDKVRQLTDPDYLKTVFMSSGGGHGHGDHAPAEHH